MQCRSWPLGDCKALVVFTCTVVFILLLITACCCISGSRLLQPAQVCDVLKGFIMVLCYFMMSYVDYSMMYHLIRGQSVIKLYIIYNMLEVQPDDTGTRAPAQLSSAQQLLCPPVVLSGGRPPVLLLRPGHTGRSVLDRHRTQGEEEGAHRRDSSLFHGCALRLYPSWETAVCLSSCLLA